MKNKMIFVMTLISILILTMGMINAEERPIYVGDIIELNIDSYGHSVSDIEIAFEAFEIIELTEEDDMYKLKIRSFDVGEHIVNIGNAEVIISVSTLLVEDNKALVAGETDLLQGGLVLPWMVFKIIALVLSLIGMFTFIVLLIKSRPRKPLSNYDTFIIQLNNMNSESDDYAYHLTGMFKTYITKQFRKPFNGLTTHELVNDLRGVDEVKDSIELIAYWLNKCDTFKYSKDKANVEAKTLIKQELLTIIDRIEKNSEVII